MLRFASSGGNFMFSNNSTGPGIWSQTNGAGLGITNSIPAGTVDNFAWHNGVNGSSLRTNSLGSFSGLVSGYRLYCTGLVNNQRLLSFIDSSGNQQCDVRMNAAGNLFFTRNGTVIGSTSTLALVPGVWIYIEFLALLSTTGTGTCTVVVNGATAVSSTGLTNATTTALAAMTQYEIPAGGYMKDFYSLDTGSGVNTTFLGDVNVVELFAHGAGVNSAWTPNVGPFTLTSVNGTGVYQGTITGGASNAYVGYNFNVTGFTNGANNVTGAVCTASSATSITLTATTVIETHSGSAAFECIVEIGINQSGTRPNGDVAYISDSTTNDISDFSHQALVLGGSILGVVHLSNMRKDDAGTRQAAQVCLSSGTTEVGTTQSLGNSYQYFMDILETDPHTGSQFTVSGLNGATFGVKEIT